MERRRRPAELHAFLRRLRALGIAIVALLLAGTAGFMLTLHDGAWDAFQRALDTVATTGAIAAPTDTGAQIVRSLITILGVGTLFYALVSAAEFFVSGHVADLLRERRRQRTMDALTDHYIICGFGRVGRQVARDLRAAGARYVIIDPNPENREAAERHGVGVRYLEGSASDDDVLRAAGIERARGVVACVDSDSDNVFITLTARGLRPDIEIVARAAREESESKLQRAGADRVVSPYKSSGAEMARLALHPYVSGVVDVAPEYRMEELEVGGDCQAAGRTISDIRGGAIIVAIRRADGTFQAQPPGESVLRAGDVIVALGTANTMSRIEGVFAPAAAAASGS